MGQRHSFVAMERIGFQPALHTIKKESLRLLVIMNGSKYILTLFLLSMALLLKAQTFTLSGKVSDDNGDAIELATVSCLEQGAVTMANLKGEYSLKYKSITPTQRESENAGNTTPHEGT